MRRLLAVGLVIVGAAAAVRAEPRRLQRIARAPALRTAARASDHVLVRFKPGAEASAAPRFAARAASSMPKIGWQRLSVAAGETPESLVERLRADPDVASAAVDHVRYADFVPDDPFYDLSWHLPQISAPAAWNSATGVGIKIAVADSGAENHEDLQANLLNGHNVLNGTSDTTDTLGHGTAVSGVAAAAGNNGLGSLGVAFRSSILPVKITTDGTAFDSTIADAIAYAADSGARVINISYSDPVNCEPEVILAAAQYMRSKGGLVVVSEGNAASDRGCSDDPELISVSATGESDTITTFSSFGNDVDISAPGEMIVAPYIGGFYAYVDGTSFSAPIVSGILALIFSIDSSFTPDQAQQILFDSADDLGAPGRDKYYGVGRANAARAVQLAQERSVTFRQQTLSNIYAYPNPWDVRKHAFQRITFVNLPDGVPVKIFTVAGFWVKTLQPENGSAYWDLKTDGGQPAASGLYLWVAEGSDGQTARGTVALIR